MKRILSLLLAVLMLCTPAAALDLSEYEQAIRDLKNSQFFTELFNNEELKAATQQLIEELRITHEDIKAMSDEELRQFITDTAADYYIPPMNEEQIQFLMDLARSLETAEQLGETVKKYEQKVNQTANTAKTIFNNLGAILDKLNTVLDTLNGLMSKLGISAEEG